MPSTRTTLASVLFVLAGCTGGGAAPEVVGLADQVAQVGTELSIEIVATDPDGDDLSYAFSADAPDIQSRATITRSPSGSGIFRWTPLAQDVGLWYFDFTASDSANDTTVTITIDVRSAVGQNSAPIFREPLGTGTTLELDVASCLDLDIVIEDQDSTSVVIAQDAPVIEGAEVNSTGGLTGSWHWCPSEAQIAADDRYMLLLSADDLSNPKTVKDYLVVLRSPPKPDCPGDGPVITHTAMDESTVGNLTIVAEISDDLGLKNEPLFYYATTPPATPPDLSSMTQRTMILLDGDMQDGVWAADVPNPVAGEGAGAEAELYYVIVADDNDDADGDCDHVTQAPDPESGSFQMTVTNPGGTGDAGLCESCSADDQCGDPGALCVRVGPAQDSFCLQACDGPGDCPTDFTCSPSEVESVDGDSGKQCVPNSNDCSDPGAVACFDDEYEDNDTRADAAFNPPLPAGLYDLVSCPAASGTGDDEDFFEIVLTQSAQVTIELAGGSESDLDLALLDEDGLLLQSSGSLTSDESVTDCLAAGTYYIRVYAYGPVENGYLLDYAKVNMACGGPVCEDDNEEQDDDAAHARETNYPLHTSYTNAICAGDDDWYLVPLYNGEVMTVDLTFTQASSLEDLDLHFYNSGGTDLTPCSEAMPSSCTVAQGQSADSDEHYVYTAPASGCSAGCDYYVVVRGWDGSENLYDIAIEIE